MRLLNVHTLLIENFPVNPPPYATLSHRWEWPEELEVSFQDILQLAALPGVKNKRGFAKILGCCEQAKKHSLDYVWIDTCCIDRTNSTELHEAINSMWSWYQECARCFVYMSDVRSDQDPHAYGSDFSKSQWFKRGWTLQELLAPGKVTFFAQDWQRIGKLANWRIKRKVSCITGIPQGVLSDGEMGSYSIARRMFWASQRVTTKVEDRAYSLMGIFEITMPIIYGGGENMFIRFQQEMMKKSVDHSIFAWTVAGASPSETTGLLTSAPTYFLDVDEIPYEVFISNHSDMIKSDPPHQVHFTDTNLGIHITLPMKRVDSNFYLAMLRCSLPGKPHEPLCIYLQPVPGFGNQWARTRIGELIPAPRDGELFTNTTIFAKKDASFFDPQRRQRAVSIDSSMSAVRDSVACSGAGESIRRSSSTNAPKRHIILEFTSDIALNGTSGEARHDRDLHPTRPRNWREDDRKKHAAITAPPKTPLPLSMPEEASMKPAAPSKTASPNHALPAPSTESTSQSKKPTPSKDSRKDIPLPTSIGHSISAPSQLTTERQESPESQQFARPQSVPRGFGTLEGPVTKIWYSKAYAKAHPDLPQYWDKRHRYSRSLSPSACRDQSASAWRTPTQSSDRQSNQDRNRAQSLGRKEASPPSSSNPPGEQPVRHRPRGRVWFQKPVGLLASSTSPPRRVPPTIIVTPDEDIPSSASPNQSVAPPYADSDSSYSKLASSTSTTPPAMRAPWSQSPIHSSEADTARSSPTDSDPTSVDDDKFVAVTFRSKPPSPTTSALSLQRLRSNSEGGSLMRRLKRYVLS